MEEEIEALRGQLQVIVRFISIRFIKLFNLLTERVMGQTAVEGVIQALRGQVQTSKKFTSLHPHPAANPSPLLPLAGGPFAGRRHAAQLAAQGAQPETATVAPYPPTHTTPTLPCPSQPCPLP